MSSSVSSEATSSEIPEVSDLKRDSETSSAASASSSSSSSPSPPASSSNPTPTPPPKPKRTGASSVSSPQAADDSSSSISSSITANANSDNSNSTSSSNSSSGGGGGGGAANSADAQPTEHSGNYKVSDKALKGLDAIVNADSGDESLRRYKEQLLGAALKGDKGDLSDPRQFICTEFRVTFAEEEGRPDIVHNISEPAGLATLMADGISMKEGAKFKFRISFRVQHDILVGLKFVNKLTKMVFSDTEELTLGSYPPASEIKTFEFPEWSYNEAPSGMLFRGTYKANNSIIDGDNKNHLSLEYNVHINKTW